MSSAPKFLSAEEWLDLKMEDDENQIVIGSRGNAIIRPFTKNIIEAPEKAFKTTFMLRQMLASSCGKTVFPQLPVIRPRRVLYVHGELSPPEVQERTRAAARDLPRPLTNFVEGRDFDIHLGKKKGQESLFKIISQTQPQDLVIDPWQAFIPGFDENEFMYVSLATNFMDRLIDGCKVTIYLVTHMGKDHSRGTRGHSSLAGWRDTLIKLERRKKELVEVTVEPRWAAPVKPFLLKFKDGTMESTEETEFSPQAEKIRSFLQEHDGQSTKDEVGAFLGITGDALRKALDRARDQNAIVIVGEKVRLPEIHKEITDEMDSTFGL